MTFPGKKRLALTGLLLLVFLSLRPGAWSAPDKEELAADEKVLKDAGLVSERAVGTRRVYRLNPTAVAALRDQLDTFWQRALASYVDVAEQATEESS